MDNHTETVRRLEPCPFCGGEARTFGAGRCVCCPDDKCAGWDCRAAPEAWNRRAIQSGIEADRQGRDDGLREALRPFAEIAPDLDGLDDDAVMTLKTENISDFTLTVGDFRRALSAHAPSSEAGWCFDMDKAPRDGTEITLFFPSYAPADQIANYQWNDIAEQWDGIDGYAYDDGEDAPTAWRLLPTPPIPAKREEG